MSKHSTFKRLRSPKTGKELELVAADDGTYLTAGDEKYRIDDGIARLLDETAVHGEEKKYKRFYDYCASLVDPMVNAAMYVLGSGREAAWRTAAVESMSLRGDESVLEVACGTGTNFRYLPEGCRFTGLDMSMSMLRRCQKNLAAWGRTAELVHGTSEILPYASSSFDVILTFGAFKHFNDKPKALAEMARVARPGGKVVVIDAAKKTVNWVEKVPLVGRYFKGIERNAFAPIDFVPEGMLDVGTQMIARKGTLYMLSFTKPKPVELHRVA